ncbi:hypothetical protein ACFSC4_18215 [Deinococcus malanensis]|nr:hypothetical protein [Deinococcus malanensis]
MLGHASQAGLHDHERFLRAYPPYGTLDRVAGTGGCLPLSGPGT